MSETFSRRRFIIDIAGVVGATATAFGGAAPGPEAPAQGMIEPPVGPMPSTGERTPILNKLQRLQAEAQARDLAEMIGLIELERDPELQAILKTLLDGVEQHIVNSFSADWSDAASINNSLTDHPVYRRFSLRGTTAEQMRLELQSESGMSIATLAKFGDILRAGYSEGLLEMGPSIPAPSPGLPTLGSEFAAAATAPDSTDKGASPAGPSDIGGMPGAEMTPFAMGGLQSFSRVSEAIASYEKVITTLVDLLNHLSGNKYQHIYSPFSPPIDPTTYPALPDLSGPR